MRQTLKQFILALCALQLLLAPDVCLMLCCHTPVAITAESDLPPCHRKAQTAKASANILVNAPCAHTHDEKPAALQAAQNELRSCAFATIVPARHDAQTQTALVGQNARRVSPTVSPPFRERNLPLRI